MKKKRIYIDLDGVLVNYKGEKPINFLKLDPMWLAIYSFETLFDDDRFDVYIASTAPWSNPDSWKDKRLWVEKYLGEYAFKRLVLTHNKGLLKGDYIIDDRTVNGVAEFEGEHIHFGTEEFPNWEVVLDYLDKTN